MFKGTFGKCILRFPDAFAFLSFLFFLAEKFNFSTNFQPHVGPMHCSRTHKFYFSATFSLKMGPTVLFTHLKIILLQCFSVFSCIQTDPKSKKNIWELPSSNVAEEDFLCTKMFIQAFLHHYPTVIIVQFIEIQFLTHYLQIHCFGFFGSYSFSFLGFEFKLDPYTMHG